MGGGCLIDPSGPTHINEPSNIGVPGRVNHSQIISKFVLLYSRGGGTESDMSDVRESVQINDITVTVECPVEENFRTIPSYSFSNTN